MSLDYPPTHDCTTASRYKCARVGKPAEVSIKRCSHGCYAPSGETTARTRNGRAYCIVCHWDQHERRRTAVPSPMYRAWPLLERRLAKRYVPDPAFFLSVTSTPIMKGSLNPSLHAPLMF